MLILYFFLSGEDEKENQIPEEKTPTAVPGDNLHDQFTFDSAHDESLINPQHWPHGFAAKLLDQAMYAMMIEIPIQY